MATYITAVSYLFQVHGLHCALHGFDHTCHGAGDLPCRDSCLYSGGNCIDPCWHPPVVQGLVLLTNGIFCMDFGSFHVSFLDGLKNVRWGGGGGSGEKDEKTVFMCYMFYIFTHVSVSIIVTLTHLDSAKNKLLILFYFRSKLFTFQYVCEIHLQNI